MKVYFLKIKIRIDKSEYDEIFDVGAESFIEAIQKYESVIMPKGAEIIAVERRF